MTMTIVARDPKLEKPRAKSEKIAKIVVYIDLEEEIQELWEIWWMNECQLSIQRSKTHFCW